MPKPSHPPKTKNDDAPGQDMEGVEGRNMGELQEAKDALLDTEERFEALLNLSGDRYWEQDEHFRFTRYSGGLEDLTSTHAASHIGKTQWEMPSSESDTADWSDHQAVLSRHEPFRNLEHKQLDENGKLIWLSTSGAPVFDTKSRFKGYRGTSRDIMQQKFLEATLKPSEEYLRMALANAEIGVWEWDMISEHVIWDKQQFALFGQPETDGKIPFSKTIDVIHPDDREELAETAKSVLEEGATALSEFRVIHPDGSVHWLLGSSGVVQFDDNRTSAKLVGVNIDITKSKQHDAVLSKREGELERSNLSLEHLIVKLETERSRGDQLGAILDRSLNEIYMIDADSLRFMQVNFGARQNIGYSRDEMLDMTPLDIKPEITEAQFEEIIAPLRDGSKDLLTFSTVHQRKDHSTYPVDVTLQNMHSDGQSLFIAIIRDISEQHKMIEDLLLRDRAIAEIDIGVLITDARNDENAIIYTNAAIAKMTGYETDEMLGRNPRFLQGDDHDQPELGNIRSAISQAVPVHETLRNYRKDGSRFMAEVSISPVRDDAGEVTHYIGIQADVTSKLEMEHRISQSQKMDAIGQLTGGIAHDFNNLLTVIIGNNELLVERLKDDEFAVSLLDDASRAAESGAQLTGQLLSFARQQPLNPKAIDLNELVHELSDMLGRTLGETITLNLKLADGLGRLFADPVQVHNALLNLAINARDAMPAGGDLTIETSSVEFDVEMARERNELAPGRYARVSISDTGTGMPPDIQSRIFEPFFTTKEQGKGTGLGLSMVHGFAKQSGGYLEIYSELDNGTSISLYLPDAARLEDGETERGDTASPVEKGTETILVVEDDARVRKTTINRLDHLGYEIVQAESGPQALDILAENSDIDLIFTDMVMPGGMSGADLIVEAQKLFPHIKCIITSGHAEQSAMPKGGTLWLRKPYKLQELSEMFRQQLD